MAWIMSKTNHASLYVCCHSIYFTFTFPLWSKQATIEPSCPFLASARFSQMLSRVNSSFISLNFLIISSPQQCLACFHMLPVDPLSAVPRKRHMIQRSVVGLYVPVPYHCLPDCRFPQLIYTALYLLVVYLYLNWSLSLAMSHLQAPVNRLWAPPLRLAHYRWFFTPTAIVFTITLLKSLPYLITLSNLAAFILYFRPISFRHLSKRNQQSTDIQPSPAPSFFSYSYSTVQPCSSYTVSSSDIKQEPDSFLGL